MMRDRKPGGMVERTIETRTGQALKLAESRPMLTRRKVLLAAIGAGVAMRTRMAFAKASQPATPVDFEVPTGACDCHTHIHADPEKFPFFSGRVYTPEVALPEEMAA